MEQETPLQTLDRPIETTEADWQVSWKPELMEALYNALYIGGDSAGGLEHKVAELELVHGPIVYAEVIFLLSHLRFEIDQAREHWKNIIAHRSTIKTASGRAIDLRIALLSYFLEVNRQIKNPKIIELELFERTRASAYRDELTGLHNYRFFRESIGREIERSRRQRTPLSLVMIDVDDFKTYNDLNGHEAGNEILSSLGHILLDSTRLVDVAARYGGEEFCMLLPETFKTAAYEIAERLRKAVEVYKFPNGERQPMQRLTISCGVATFPGDAVDGDHLIRAADRAMYFAKADGKNQVELYGHDRRSFQRISASIAGSYQVVNEKVRSLATINISEGGVLFESDRVLSLGALIDVDLSLPDGDEIRLSGRVVSVKEKGATRFEMGMRTIDVDAGDLERLTAHLDKLKIS